MKLVWQIMKLQVLHMPVILRLSAYEVKKKYTAHYFGAIWQIMNSILQLEVSWFVFGFCKGGSPVGDTPFFVKRKP